MKLDFIIIDEYGLFNPIEAGKAYGWTVRFKGGGGGDSPPSSQMADTEIAKEARSSYYPILERGMAGRGLTTDAVDKVRKDRAYSGLENSFAQTSAGMKSTLARMLPGTDDRVSDYIDKGLQREFITAKDSVRRGFNAENLTDKDTAMGMTAATVGNEMRMGVSSMQAYNQAAQGNATMQANMGTFGTNLMGGIGSGMTSAYFAQKWNAGGTVKP